MADITFDKTPNIEGSVAHDDADSGNPVKVGLKALSHGSSPSAVAAGDRTDLYANRHGVPWVIGGSYRNTHVTRRDNFTSAQTDTALVTVASGLGILVYRITVAADAANSDDVAVLIGVGTASTPTGAGVLLAHPRLHPGGVLRLGDGSGIIGMGADNEDLRITCDEPTGGSIDLVTTYEIITVAAAA